jgi:hypothetical protein
VQEEWRQHEHRNRIRPVEHPIEAIEPAAEREGEDTEEGHRQPEEMERRGIAGTAQPHGAADQQRKDADSGKQEVQRSGSARNGRDSHIHDLARTESQDRIANGLAGIRSLQHLHHVGQLLDRTVIDGQEQVAALDADRGGWRSGADVGRHDAVRLRCPEHAIFDRMPRRTRGDIRNPEAQQPGNDENRKGGTSPMRPRARRVRPSFAVSHL